ncbi:MAG: LapA family protein [Pseudomonadota bacterium]
MLRLFRFAVYFSVGLVGLVFALLNAQAVPFNYYVGSREIPLAFIVAMAVGFGALLGIAASLTVVVRAKREAAGLRKNVNVAERELANLRTIPYKDQP